MLPVWLSVLLAVIVPVQLPAAETASSFALDGWTLQSSARVTESGEALSTPGAAVKDWYPALVPGTVLGALAKDQLVPNPYYGVNLRNTIGDKFRSDKIQAELPMDPASRFAVPWWYRTEFTVPRSAEGKTVWMRFAGINYRADIWINGHKVADAGTTAGTWRTYEFDITAFARPGATNAIAVKVYPPIHSYDLAISFVDWNPGPPDRDMGLFGDVSVVTSGPVAVRYPLVLSRLQLPDTSRADLTIVTRLTNATDQPQIGTLAGEIENISVSQKVELKPGESRDVFFDSTAYPQLRLQNPRLWWPAQMGQPNLYPLHMRFVIDGKESDAAQIRFGIREITSELDENDHRLFRINGKRLLIQGGGWAMDLLMEKSSQRLRDELQYVSDLGLNTIRLEGMFERDEFYDLADERGILIMPGISCSLWQTWPRWGEEQVSIAVESVRSQMLRMRSHPSMLVWLNGSDDPPPAELEKKYLAVERETLWPNPVISSASGQATSVTGKSGVKMTGPYEYVLPEFFMVEKGEENDRGGAFGFNTETGPGPAIPEIETLQEILPKEHLWPIDDWWTFHTGLVDFRDFHVFVKALNQRYGDASDLSDFLVKSQMMRYEAIRAMYEAYGRNKYASTGVVIWMLNNAWPSMIWSLYDYQLRVAGGYFGAKTALEPLHPLYGYDDHAVWVVSSQYKDVKKLNLTATIYDLDMKPRFSRKEVISVPADSTNKAFALPAIAGLTPVYFLKLMLTDDSGKVVGSNFYWLSAKPETITQRVPNVGDAFAQTYADFRGLNRLPKVSVKLTTETKQESERQVTHVQLKNENPDLAFFIRLNLSSCNTGKEILPILWSDNYISLLPGETRDLTATYGVGQEAIRVEAGGWNVKHLASTCAGGPQS
jgi:exo-1,4-beta-D-glucosaminidase